MSPSGEPEDDLDAPPGSLASPVHGARPAAQPRRAACTIIAKNYLAYARVLARSFQVHHPDARMFVLLVDDVEGSVDAGREPFAIVHLKDLPLEQREALCFKYSVLELCTAVKPFFLEHLFDRFGVTQLLYLDPDILVLDSLAPLYDLTERRSIVLTPHITHPISDDALPGETTFLQTGVYNLGFLGLADTATTRRMLGWWQHHCAEQCIVRLEDGLFVDQKWMDLIPALFPDFAVVTTPGYNVAYWNLHGRHVSRHGSRWQANDEPLHFFHFSGYDPLLPGTVSKHQTRYKMGDLGELQDLFADYRARLLDAGYRELIESPYSHARFDNGVRVSPIVRDLYYRLGPQRQEFGNPFASGGETSFFSWLNAPAAHEESERPYISNLVAHILSFRRDVKEAFPEFRGRQRAAFLEWVRSVGQWQLDLDPPFLAPLAVPEDRGADAERPALRQVVLAFAGASCRVCPLVMVVDHHGYGWKIRALAQRFFARGQNGHREDAPAPAAPAVAPAGRPPRSWLARTAARAIRRTLRPCTRHRLLHNLVDERGDALPGLSPVPRRAASRPAFGVNVAGYFSTESGVGEAARMMAAAIRTADLGHALINFEASYGLRRTDRTFTEFSATNPYGMNLVHVNADQMQVFAEHYGPEFFAGRYNVGYWMWELEEFPAHWQDHFHWFDEIWAPSQFTARAIAARSPVPVRTVAVPVHAARPAEVGRAHFGLPTDRFVFLFIFDFASVFERKNPLAVVEAFRRAFQVADDVRLVLKCSNAELDQDNAARLRDAARQDPRVILVDGYLSRAEVSSLIDGCDAYVSLHRSEGYGLTMAEAMAAGKPVIATDYSGNVDFMTPENSFPVRYRLVESTHPCGPYPKGTRWADADVDHAAELMRRVVVDRDEAARIGRAARGQIERVLAPAAIGARVRDHLRDAWERARDRNG